MRASIEWAALVESGAAEVPARSAALKPTDRLIAKALEARTAARANYETGKMVFEAHKDAWRTSPGRANAAALQDQRQRGGKAG